MSQEELEAVDVAFRRRRELEELKRDRFLEWVHEAAEAEEKAESRQRIRDLELENESLHELEQQDVDPVDTSREEFEKDMMLTDQAEVLSEILADEELTAESERASEDAVEPAESTEETVEAEAELEDESAEPE